MLGRPPDGQPADVAVPAGAGGAASDEICQERPSRRCVCGPGVIGRAAHGAYVGACGAQDDVCLHRDGAR
jgi:hypothetical protein